MARMVVLVILIAALRVASAAGQSVVDLPLDVPPEMRLHLGGVALNPALEIATGLDTNVFNEVVDPKRDVMTSISPRADAWLRLGRARVAARGQADFIHFSQYAGERSINGQSSAAIVLPFNHVRPYVAGSYLATRQRPTFEIDTRSRRRDTRGAGGVDVRLSPITSVRVDMARARTAYDADAVFLGTYLRDVLNRESTTIGLSMRQSLTTVTTFTVSGEIGRDVFQFSSERNTKSRRVTASLDFAPSALLSGSANIGWRSFEPRNSLIPVFRGVTGAAELSYILLGSTRLTVLGSRDVEYSFEQADPYYVQTGAGGMITQRLTNSVGVTATGRMYFLQFRGATAVARLDRYDVAGLGAFYRIGRSLRLNLDTEYYTRRSPLSTHDFRGLRATTSLIFGA